MADGSPPRVDLDEVVLVGPHPDWIGVEVVVVGSSGRDVDWQFACQLATTALTGAAARGIHDPGCVVVDAKHDVVRPAKALRRFR